MFFEMAGLLRKVYEVHIEVADSCNLDCGYCYYVSKRKKTEAFPLSQFEAIFERLFTESREDINIVFHGGEPLLRPASWFDERCASARKLAERHGKQIRFQLQTNGTLLTDEHVAVFAKHHVVVSVSLDGPSDVHNAMRGGFAKTVSAIQRLQEAGVFGSVIAVISKHNYDKVADAVSLFKDLHVKQYHFNIASIVGEDKSLVLSKDEMLVYYKEAYKAFKENYKEICDWMLLGKLTRLVEGRISEFHCDSPICGAGLFKIHILPDGTYYPCGSCVTTETARQQLKQGNLLDPSQDRDEIFLKDFHSLYFDNREKCEQCEAAIVCDFYCPAFDKMDPITADHRCEANQMLYAFLLEQDRKEMEEIVNYYKTQLS